MPDSNRSYAERQQRADVLVTNITAMTPAFSPMDASLSIANFGAFVDSVGQANDDVDSALTDFDTTVNSRMMQAKAAQKLTTQIVASVKSNSAWKANFPRIKELADKVRGIKPQTKTPPPPAPEPGQPAPPVLKKRDRGDGSYAEIAANFKALAGAVGKLNGYSPQDQALSVDALNTLGGQLVTNNEAVATADSTLDTAQRKRFALFTDEDTGLADKFQAVKNAVKGQYGQSSEQYAAVKGLRW